MRKHCGVRKIAFVGDHLPRKCGIATFTSALLAAMASAYPESQCLCISVNDTADGCDHTEVVRFEIDQQDLSSYLRAADFLNESNVDVVCLQHAFGIYGGPAGDYVLAFLRELQMPIVTTLRTVLREPDPEHQRVMQDLISLSTRIVVSEECGRRMLHEIYQAPALKIDLIPQGIPDVAAAELLAEVRGVLVPFADVSAMACEVRGLLRDDPQENTRRGERDMDGSSAARQYLRSVESTLPAAPPPLRKPVAINTPPLNTRKLPDLVLRHLSRMTDGTGVFQHALFSVPNFSEGYCTDDNARAFILALQLGELSGDPEYAERLATTTASFLLHAFDPVTRRFHNHMSFERRWIDEKGSEDSHGRALWALGVGVGRSPDRSLQQIAGQLFTQSLPAIGDFTSPRAWASGLIGIHEYMLRLSGDSRVSLTREMLTGRLMKLFDLHAKPDWCWFEDELSYDNAKLAHALIVTGRATRQSAVLARGLHALRWLNDVQTSDKGQFQPIGNNGFYRRGGTRAIFDQQPIEAQSMVSACLEAYNATSDVWWYEQAQRAFDWFIGWNDLGLEIYSPQTGGCRDGIHVDRLNENQGAESTLAFLMALEEMRSARNVIAKSKGPIGIVA
ncbi:MAG: hypothetical protein ABI811_00185 [Acidobacteriota bacterium]